MLTQFFKGMGATLHWAQEAMAGLHIIINQLKVAYNVSRVRLLDVPCGDMAWMSRFLKIRDDVDYTGIDIVPELIRHHQETFKSYPWKFQLRDLVASPLNETYHLILCRTLLQHLYNYDVMKLLSHISISGSAFLLSTSFFRHKENQELVGDSENPGRFRRLNLELKPIALTPPQCMFRDGPPDAYEGWDHFLALWRLPLRKLRRCKVPTEFGLRPVNMKIFSCTNWSLPDSPKQL